MTRRPHSLAFAVASGSLVYVAAALAHEGIHVGLNLLFAGRLGACGSGLPLTVLDGGRLGVCLAPGGVPAVNAMLAPTLTALLGLAAVRVSREIDSPAVRRGAFAGGVLTWATQTAYGLGITTQQPFVRGSASHAGDAAVALARFGDAALLPAVLSLLAGLAVIATNLGILRTD